MMVALSLASETIEGSTSMDSGSASTCRPAIRGPKTKKGALAPSHARACASANSHARGRSTGKSVGCSAGMVRRLRHQSGPGCRGSLHGR